MARDENAFTTDERLLSGIAEQVKLPFVQILHAIETIDENRPESQKIISSVSQSALHLIDGYLLNVRLQREGQLDLEPVSVSSLLYDIAEALRENARINGCEINLKVAGKYGPVMAHKDVLFSALTNLGHSFIDALESSDTGQQRNITLSVRRTPAGISTGVYSDGLDISDSELQRAKESFNFSHQPMAGFSSDNAAGILVADSLFSRIDAEMRAVSLDKQRGFAITLQPSRQLSLV